MNPKFVKNSKTYLHISSSSPLFFYSSSSSSRNDLITMPCCYDGLTARLVENAGFKLTFMTGFGVSSTYGVPDVGLLGAQEMFQSAATICNSLHNIPCIGDGDTGYGNALNVKRTVMQYAQVALFHFASFRLNSYRTHLFLVSIYFTSP